MRSIWREGSAIPANPLKFFFYMSKPHARAALLAIFFVLAAGTLQASVPFLYKIIAEGVIALTAGNPEPVYTGVILYICVALLGHFMWRASGFAGSYWATGIRATARDALFSHLGKHSYSYFSNRFAGSLLSKVKQAADGMRDVTSAFLWEILSFLVAFFVSFCIVFATNAVGGLILLGLFVVVLPINYYLSKVRLKYSVAAQDAETQLNGATVDAITNVTAMHEYANRTYEIERLRTFTLRRRALGMRNWWFGEWMLTANGVFVHVFMGALMLGSVSLAVQGIIEPGDIILFLATAWLIEGHFIHLSQQFNSISETWGQVRESLADLLVTHDVPDQKDAREIDPSDSSLALKDISFAYGGKQVFKDLSLMISPGEKVGLIGKSGAGKSTLMKLILRHYDLESGSIEIGATDIKEVTKESVRKLIALVPQEPSLFHRTIHENIAYGNPAASRDDVVRAAKLAEAHDFISELPEGYESLVGERGVKLSGGQRQRVAIARAILKDAPLLLLDEATSALDSESEALVQKAFLNLMKGRTVIAIAHRLSTLRAMDRLIVFDKGAIVEDGTHEELLRKQGLYADLWHRQAGGFITDEG